MYFVYIIKCSDETLYIGLTHKIRKRIREHTNHECKSTKYRTPVRLIWFCVFPDKFIAARFEKYLKSHSGKAFLNKRLVYAAKCEDKDESLRGEARRAKTR